MNKHTKSRERASALVDAAAVLLARAYEVAANRDRQYLGAIGTLAEQVAACQEELDRIEGEPPLLAGEGTLEPA